MKKGRISIFFLLLSIWVGHIFATQKDGNLIYFVDTANFKMLEQDKTFFQLYFYVAPSQLDFRKEEGKYIASFQIHLTLRDTLGNEVKDETWKNLVMLNTLQETKVGTPIFDVQSYLLDPGIYDLHIRVTDLNSDKYGDLSSKVRVRRFSDDRFELSDIQFAISIKRSNSKMDRYFKSGLKIMPNPTRIFGINLPIMYFYLEVYNLNYKEGGNGTYEYEICVYDENNRKVITVPKVKKPILSRTEIINNGLNVIKLATGYYILSIKVQDNTSGNVAIAQDRFQIYRPPAGPIAKLSKFPVLTEKLAQEYYDEIKYIATKDELKIYKSLNLEGKRNFLQKFWNDRDPDPNTPMNEAYQEHLRRLKYVREHFSSSLKDGLKTDMGRIYIIYGEPDEIERHLREAGYKPYEIWKYFGKQGGIEFIFADIKGTGEYELLHSTARKERKDYDWRKWIKVR